MSQKNFNMIAGGIFLIVAIVHLLRVLNGTAVFIGDMMIPMWASWAGLIIAAILGFYGIKHGK